jgi:hypothetical protein
LERRPQAVISASMGSDPTQLEHLAEQLFPYIRQMFERLGSDSTNTNDKRSARRSKSSPELPLKD